MRRTYYAVRSAITATAKLLVDDGDRIHVDCRGRNNLYTSTPFINQDSGLRSRCELRLIADSADRREKNYAQIEQDRSTWWSPRAAALIDINCRRRFINRFSIGVM